MNDIDEVLKKIEQKKLTPAERKKLAIERYFTTFAPIIREEILSREEGEVE